jgi:hypothetical protein
VALALLLLLPALMQAWPASAAAAAVVFPLLLPTPLKHPRPGMLQQVLWELLLAPLLLGCCGCSALLLNQLLQRGSP